MTLALLNEWMGLPMNASAHGGTIDGMLELVHWVMLSLFVGWSIFLIYVFTRFRASRNPKASYTGVTNHASTHIEIGVVVVEIILLAGFAFPIWGQRVGNYPTGDSGQEPLKVRAMGKKFGWEFHYPGPDGKLGRVDPSLIDVANNNTIGLDLSDPAAQDDFVVQNELYLEKDRDVVIEVMSRDVIHNLALVKMRIAQDATPGERAHMWFRPVVLTPPEGGWDIICGQLCGSGHALMKATMFVVNPKDFEEWSKGFQPFKNAISTPAASSSEEAPASDSAPAAEVTPAENPA